MMKFEIFGPFELPRKDGRIDDEPAAKNKFWNEKVSEGPKGCLGLPDARGCYVFALKAAKGIVPWYVGLTKKSFRKECLGVYQLHKYSHVSKNKGLPLLYLLAKKTQGGTWSKPSKSKNGHGDIKFLEDYLIGLGLRKNAFLLNQAKTKYFKSLSVPGVLNSGKGKLANAATSLKVALGLR